MEEEHIKVSVAMATYNGETYIKEQIESILSNLKENDELVISDDGSNDNTVNFIKEYIKQDSRIKLLDGPRKGVKQNFSNAIYNTTGDYIFLCDQDDIWDKNKVENVIKELKNNILVVHDAEIINENKKIVNESFFEFRNSGPGRLKNIYKNTYIGCCMAFKKELKQYILPIPNNIEMHDQWIGIIAEKHGKVKFIKDKLIMYRRHSNNVSSFKHYSVNKMIRNRLILILELIKNRRK